MAPLLRYNLNGCSGKDNLATLSAMTLSRRKHISALIEDARS
jgi:hypothetical protein